MTRLRRLQAGRRLTVNALERRAGLGHTTVSQALNGRTVPTEATILALARALGADPEDLPDLRAKALLECSDNDCGREGSVFELRYRDYVASRHGQLSVIGVDLAHPGWCYWPMEAAYVGLQLTRHEDRDRWSEVRLSPGQDWREALAGPTDRVERADLALADSRLVVIRGLAGSGKTTFLQWLAIGAARGTLPDSLSHLAGRVPFMVPFRSLALGAGLPGPERLLAAVGCPLAERQPDGWAAGVLASGRGLMLLDGVDEMAAGLRERARAWVSELVAAYPRLCVVVTTRPSAVPEGWLAGLCFTELTVRPMSASDVQDFIRRWHAAATVGISEPGQRDELACLAAHLADEVPMRSDLSRLASSPLLCALICALHRDRRGYLPSGRVELYEAALSMLLSRRDLERGIDAPEGIRLTERQSVQLLQRLAYWLARNGHSEMSWHRAADLITKQLSPMPDISRQGDAAAILTHLVTRSGVLRHVAADALDFVHRTFQDYLSARAAVEDDDLGLLIRNAHDDQWHDVIRLATAHARPAERAFLLQGLIQRGDREPDSQARLHLLAVACLEYATELAPDTRRQVQERAARLLPPRDDTDARELAAIGPAILELLPGPDGIENDEAIAVIKTAALIGGDQAMAFLKRFWACPPARSPFEPWYHLGDAWQRFSSPEYAQHVLQHMPPPRFLTVTNRAELEELPGLQPVDSISLRGDFTAADITSSLNYEHLRVMSISSNAAISDLSFIRAFTDLKALHLRTCSPAMSLTPLQDLPIETLTLNYGYGQAPVGLEALARMTQLDWLCLDITMPVPKIGQMPLPANLGMLFLGPAACDSCTLDGISRWSRLRVLQVEANPASADYRELSQLPELKRLTLEGDKPLKPFAEMSPLTQIKDLWIVSWTEDQDLAIVLDKFPSLEEISIYCRRGSYNVDITPLAASPHLKIRLIDARQVQGTGHFEPESIIRVPRPR
jgi:transcriptional regulator with XRE-family HTH domain